MSAFNVSSDNALLDVALIHRFLSTQSNWARGIPLPIVEKAIANSLCFGGYVDRGQVAFARVVTDYATFANLVDVFVLPEYQARGYSKTLLREIFSDPRLQGLRRFTLATGNAHGLYAQFGFTTPHKPDTLMERYAPEIYCS
jgi:N-acetylglutamate synthase-like GNAT family acetyltransferase